VDPLLNYLRIRLNELRRAVVEKINESILRHFKLLRLAELEYLVLAEDFAGQLLSSRAEGFRELFEDLFEPDNAVVV